MIKDIWKYEYVEYDQDMKEHIVTFLEDDPYYDDWEHTFVVTEDGKEKHLVVEKDALLYQIKALIPIKNKTVSIKCDDTPGVHGFTVTEWKI